MKSNYFNFSPSVSMVIRSVLYWLLFLLLLIIFGSLSNSLLPKTWSSLFYGTIATLAAAICTGLFIKIEKKTLVDYGLVWEKQSFGKFIVGLIMGIIIFSILILILLGFTDLKMMKSNKVWEFKNIFWYLLIIPAAFMEELAFRSYAFINLNKVFGLRITQIIVAIAFAVYHILMGWGVEIAFLGPAIWSFVFGLAAVWSKGIALPTGIHVALNLMQQIVGLKTGDSNAIWKMQQNATATEASLSRTETVGILTQLLVFIVAILVMELFHRKNKIQYS